MIRGDRVARTGNANGYGARTASVSSHAPTKHLRWQESHIAGDVWCRKHMRALAE